MARSRSYQTDLIESLKDSREAAAYLHAALGDGDQQVFLLALRNVVEARGGGIGNVSRLAGLNRESLYRMLSETGNPQLDSLRAILDSLGLQLSVSSKAAS